MLKPTTKKFKLNAILLSTLPLLGAQAYATDTDTNTVKTCQTMQDSGEVTQYNHFIEPIRHTFDNFKSRYGSAAFGNDSIESHLYQRGWATFYKGNGDNINSVKWYGVFRVAYKDRAAAASIADGIALRDSLLKTNFKLDMKGETQSLNGSKGGAFSQLSIEDSRQFIGVPKATLKEHWIMNIPEDVTPNISQHPDIKIEKNPDYLNTLTGVIHTYIIEYSANLPQTCIHDVISSYKNDVPLFVSTTPILGEKPNSVTKITWNYIIPDEIGAGPAGHRLIQRQANVDSPQSLSYRVRGKEGRSFTGKVINGLEFDVPTPGPNKGFTISMGLFADKLADTPTLKPVTETVKKVVSLTAKNTELQRSLETETTFKNQERERAERLTTQLDTATAKAVQLTLKNQNLKQTADRIAGHLETAEKRVLELTTFYNKAEFQLTNPSSRKCIDVRESGLGNNTNVILYHCHGNKNQKWVYNEVSGQIKTTLGNQCLDVGGTPQSGTNLQTMTCLPFGHNNMKNQSFTIDGNLIKLRSNTNLVIDSIGNHNGANVIIHNQFGGSTTQVWNQKK
ncbi:hypothetical protein D5018_19485 [Parashewanella curva]|uniref:Ricin B lectin domain-containing protein n=1 Tax=Parashewanella curva TaxID=2338552 RepID=A0A3L8PRJ2_9GAMM|nr:RICIN domain-containing protein [Parashewanella curva]RLV58020.1 hypothetical protein D5018_19485 [Parashewanella curva]